MDRTILVLVDLGRVAKKLESAGVGYLRTQFSHINRRPGDNEIEWARSKWYQIAYGRQQFSVFISTCYWF